VSFLAPAYLTAAVVAAVGAVLLHFIVTRRPRSVAFPTARFVPDVPVAARARSVQLSDLLLLAVRVLTILFAGAALARPVFPPHREHIVRVIAADVSGSIANIGEIRDSVRSLYRPGDAIVVFDTAAKVVLTPDSVAGNPGINESGSLSAGLIAALHEGSRVRDGADSVELVLVSPVTVGESDRATRVIRAQWRGRARVIAVGASVRPAPSSPDPTFLGAMRPMYAVARNRIDTVGAVIARGNVVVAPFERRWRFTSDSLAHASVIARWADGEPAAIEHDSGETCTRSIAIPIDSSGDMMLRPSFVRFRAALSAPCQSVASPPDGAAARMLAGAGNLASTAQFPPPDDIDSPLARWLAAIAIVLAIADMVLRRSRDARTES
jgi:hypothetical protein